MRKTEHGPIYVATIKRIMYVAIVLLASHAAPLKAEEVVSCLSMGLDPHVLDPDGPGSVWLLGRYYIEENGVGGRGCWVHKHPNGKDFVLTPHNWHRHPTAVHRYLVGEALQAITDSRRVFSSLGTLHKSLYFLLDDVHVDAEIYWPLGLSDECWMEAGPYKNIRSWQDPDTKHFFKGMVAHEIGHCFIQEQIENFGLGFNSSSYAFSNAHWWDESAADFLSSIVYPSLDFEHMWAKEFDLGSAPFTQEYSASVLLTSYANSKGNQAVITLLKNIYAATRNNPDHLYSYLKSIGFDTDFHDFVVDHYLRQVPDLGGGFVPRETDVQSITSTTLKEGEFTIDIPPLLPGRLSVVSLTVPEGMQATITAPDEAGLSQSVVENFELTHKNWTGTLSTEILCGPNPVEILFSHLNDAPVNTRLTYTLTNHPEACQERISNHDRCLVGSWYSNEDDYKKMIEDTMHQFEAKGMANDIRAHELNISKADINLVVAEDGRFTQHGRINGEGSFLAIVGRKPVVLTVGLNYEDDAKGALGGNPETGNIDIGVNESRHHDYGSHIHIISPEIEAQLAIVPPEMRDVIKNTLDRPYDGGPMFVEGVQTRKYQCNEDTLSFPVEGKDGITLNFKFHRQRI